MTTNIYFLELKNNKYYIGKSTEVELKYKIHLNGTATYWTNINKPISIIKIINDISPYELDKYVKEYMYKYGIANVRGGSYYQLKLNDNTIKKLENELNTCYDMCYKCSKSYHFVTECDFIPLDDYVDYFNRGSIKKLEKEILYLKKLIEIVTKIEEEMTNRDKLLLILINIDNKKRISKTILDKYSKNIEKYYNTYCKDKSNYSIEDTNTITIKYYNCLFEYYDNEKNLYESFINITRHNEIKISNMECEKYNTTIDNIDLVLLKRKLSELKFLK
jgi:hypothetical protein